MRVSIDDAGLGHVLGGAFIGLADEDAAGRSYVGEISISYFKENVFDRKLYLERAREIVSEGVEALGVTKSDIIYCCSGYILSRAREALSELGLNVKVESHHERQAHFLVESARLNYLQGIGAPVADLLPEDSDRARARNFRLLLKWAYADPGRMQYVKTGWKYFRKLKRA
jgi:hypothetical protein